MLTGFALILLAGAAFYVSPRHADGALYATLGNYLMAGGFVIYVVGRIVRGRPRRNASRD